MSIIPLPNRLDKPSKEYDISELEKIMRKGYNGTIECESIQEFRKQFLSHGHSWRYVLVLHSMDECFDAMERYGHYPELSFICR